MPLPLSAAATIASYATQPGDGPEAPAFHVELSQAVHRIHLINAWGDAIQPGTRILELGCGQGTSTQALAEAIRPAPSSSLSASEPNPSPKPGHITALDPGPPDYGSPVTLAQAQANLSSGPIGSLITFHRADPVTFLSETNPTETWDVAVLSHCIWYFPTPTTLSHILTALRGRVSRVLIAEWALHATDPKAAPHVLAVLAIAAFEAHRVGSQANVQTPLSPSSIKAAAEKAGWVVQAGSEKVVVPEEGLDDGRWETGMVVAERFMEGVEREIVGGGDGDGRVKAMIRSARDAVVAAADGVGGVKGVRSMDVWVATLVPR